VRWADNLTTFMCRLSGNLGASISWNRQGLSRPVMGLIYLFLQWNLRIYNFIAKNIYPRISTFSGICLFLYRSCLHSHAMCEIYLAVVWVNVVISPYCKKHELDNIKTWSLITLLYEPQKTARELLNNRSQTTKLN